MFNASVRPSVRPSVCLKPKFGQLFDVSCLNLRGCAERTCHKKTKRAFDEFKSRWIPPVPLDYPQPAGFFFLGCSLTKKNPAGPGSACIDASRLIFQSAVSFQIRLVSQR